MRALIALVAAAVVALFGAAEATPAVSPTARRAYCENLAGMHGRTWGSAGPNDDGRLYFGPHLGQAIWTTASRNEVLGIYRCDATGIFLRFEGTDRDERLELQENKLVWGDRQYVLLESHGVPSDTSSPVAARTPAPVVPISGEPEPCDSLVGSIFEIQSLEGLPASADRLTGESDGAAPRRPYLVFGKGVGTWVNARGDEAPIGWRCDDRALTVTISGKPTVMFREGSGFRFGGAPVQRFQKKAATTGTLTCADLPGKVFEVRGEGAPLGTTRGKGAFQSDIDEGPRPPSIRFSADDQTLDYLDDDRRKFTVPYTCDETGVAFQILYTPNHLIWDGSGMRWRERSVRPYKTR